MRWSFVCSRFHGLSLACSCSYCSIPVVAAANQGCGARDWLIGVIIYRHGLRVSETCDLRWDDIDLPRRTIIVRPFKGSTDSVHLSGAR
jgi:integrase